jgi:hypothetical protein
MLLISGAIFACAGCDSQKAAVNKADGNEATAKATVDHKDPVQSAMAAAPQSIAGDATVIQASADGSMKTLREGKNGWTCMPDNPATPGKDPMCMDANALKWAQAWMAHRDPPADNVGLMYMLAGGSDASNMDPWGTKPEEGHKWVETGPHVMVVGSDSLNALYPSSPNPDPSKPYVMFGGTPYAHVMMPVQ